MKAKKFNDQSFFFTLNTFKNERQNLIKDSLRESEVSAELYEGLYERDNIPLRKILFERYELLMLKRHWENAMSIINNSLENERYDKMKLFVKHFRTLTANIHNTVDNENLLDSYLESIEALLDANNKWEVVEKNFRVEIMKSEAVYDDLIKSLSSGN